MSWGPTWETVYQTRVKQCPPEEVIDFVLRRFSGRPTAEPVKILDLRCGQGPSQVPRS